MTILLGIAAVLGWAFAIYRDIELTEERKLNQKAQQRAWTEYQRAESLEREMERSERRTGWVS